jgi:glutamine synthetase
MIYAGLDGIKNHSILPAATDINLFTADQEVLKSLSHLPQTLDEAKSTAQDSRFIRESLPEMIVSSYTK